LLGDGRFQLLDLFLNDVYLTFGSLALLGCFLHGLDDGSVIEHRRQNAHGIVSLLEFHYLQLQTLINILKFYYLSLHRSQLFVFIAHLSVVLVGVYMKLFLENLKIADHSLNFNDFFFQHFEHRLAFCQLCFILLLAIARLMKLQAHILKVRLQFIDDFMSILLILLQLSASFHVVRE